MFAQTTVCGVCGVSGPANTRGAKAGRHCCLGECLESAVLSTPSTNVRCGVASYAGGCEYPKNLTGALFAVGLQMSAVVAAQPPSGTFVVACDVPSRRVFGECGPLHRRVFTSCCFIPGAANTRRACAGGGALLLVLVMVTRVVAPIWCRYWYAASASEGACAIGT